jgi:hypothetical protein
MLYQKTFKRVAYKQTFISQVLEAEIQEQGRSGVWQGLHTFHFLTGFSVSSRGESRDSVLSQAFS